MLLFLASVLTANVDDKPRRVIAMTALKAGFYRTIGGRRQRVWGQKPQVYILKTCIIL